MSNCIAFSGGARWQGMTGTVRSVDKGHWVYVLLDEKPETGVIPFRERELSLLSAD